MTVCDCNVLNIESWTEMFSLRFQVAKFLGAKTPRRVTSQDAGEAESTLAKDETAEVVFAAWYCRKANTEIPILKLT